MSLWEKNILRHKPTLKKQSGDTLVSFGRKCLMRTWRMISKQLAQEIAHDKLMVIRGVLNKTKYDLDKSSIGLLLSELKIIYPEEDSDEDLVIGWYWLIQGTLCMLRAMQGNDRAMNALEVAHCCYQVVLQHELRHHQGPKKVFDPSEIEELESLSKQCHSEVRYQMNAIKRMK